MALDSGNSQYELDSSKEPWLSGALSKMSISELDDFVSFFIFVFGYRKHGKRTDVVAEINRIEKKFCYRYAVVQSKTNSYNNVLLDSRLDFDFDYLLEKTALMFYLIGNQKKREKLLEDWMFCDRIDEKHRISLLQEYWFKQLREEDNADRSEIFRVVMEEASRMLETWKTLK